MDELTMDEMVPIMLEVLESGAEFRLGPKGRSMLPSINEDTDSVMLASPNDLRIMDAVLYRRKTGNYVLHRIVAEHGDFYDMCGDNQTVIEKDVPKSSVLAKLTGVYRNGEYIPATDASYVNGIKRLYRKKPIIRLIQRIKSKVRTLLKKAETVAK